MSTNLQPAIGHNSPRASDQNFLTLHTSFVWRLGTLGTDESFAAVHTRDPFCCSLTVHALQGGTKHNVTMKLEQRND